MPVKGWGRVQNFQQEIDNANHPDIQLISSEKDRKSYPLTTGESTMGDGRTALRKQWKTFLQSLISLPAN